MIKKFCKTSLRAVIYGVLVVGAAAIGAQETCKTIQSCNAEAESKLADYVFLYHNLLSGWSFVRKSGYLPLPEDLMVRTINNRHVVVQSGPIRPRQVPMGLQLPDFAKGGTIAIRFYLNTADSSSEGQALFSLYTRVSADQAKNVLQLGRVGKTMAIGFGSGTDSYWLPLWDPPTNKSRSDSWVTVFLRFQPGSNKLQIDTFSEKNGVLDRYSARLDNGFPVKMYQPEREPKIFETVDGLTLFGWTRLGSPSSLTYINEVRVYSTALTEEQLQGVAGTRYVSLKEVGTVNHSCNSGANLTYSVLVKDNSFPALCQPGAVPKVSPFPQWITSNPQFVQFVANQGSHPALTLSTANTLVLRPRQSSPNADQRWRVEMVSATSNNARISITKSDGKVLYLTAGSNIATVEGDMGAAAAQYWHYDFAHHTLRSLLNGMELLSEESEGGVLLGNPEDNQSPRGAWNPRSLGPAQQDTFQPPTISTDDADIDPLD
jgi:hypothetical protein